MTRSYETRAGYWDRQAPTYDTRMTGVERRFFADSRAWVCGRARGATLEIAIGTGARGEADGTSSTKSRANRWPCASAGPARTSSRLRSSHCTTCAPRPERRTGQPSPRFTKGSSSWRPRSAPRSREQRHTERRTVRRPRCVCWMRCPASSRAATSPTGWCWRSARPIWGCRGPGDSARTALELTESPAVRAHLEATLQPAG